MSSLRDIRVSTDTLSVLLSPSGASKGPPVVLVPGLAAGPMPFVVHPSESLAAALAKAGLQPWTVDFEVSKRKRGPDFASLLAALDESIDALCHHHEVPRRQLQAVGHSLGGILLFAVQAGARPVGATVTLASAVRFQHADSGPWSARLGACVPVLSALQPWVAGALPTRAAARGVSRWSKALADTTALGLQFHSGTTSPAHMEAVLREGVRDLPLQLLLELASLYAPPGLRLPDGEPLACALERIQQPLLLVAGRQDQQCPLPAVIEAHRCTPQAELLEVGYTDAGAEGTGYGHLDLLSGARAPHEVFAPIVQFLRSKTAAVAPGRQA